MKIWQVQDAKAHFSEMLDVCLKKGPQMVTRRGVEAAVLVPVEQWKRLASGSKPSLKELLLGDEGRGELNIPPRRSWKWRRPERFE